MSVVYKCSVCCAQCLLRMNIYCDQVFSLLPSMFAAYECLLCMNVEFVATDICCN